MEPQVSTYVTVQFNRVECIVSEIVVSENQINLFRQDVRSIFWMESNIKIPHVDNFSLALLVNLIKLNESNSYAITTFVIFTDRTVIVEYIVIAFITFSLFVL